MTRTNRPGACRALALAFALLGWGPALPAGGDAVDSYTVVLESPSVGSRISMSRAKGLRRVPARVAASSFSHLARTVERTQEPVISALEGRGIKVLGSVRNVLNAIFVRASADQAEQIASLPGVASVTPGRRFDLSLDTVSEVVGLSALRLRSDGVRATGADVKIAIIDSGLDFSHEAFQDDTLPTIPGYPKGRPEHLEFANSKIVAVRSYIHLQNTGQPATSTPDDETPRDASGHGTAVAMIAAGRRVDSPVGPLEGVAPRAHLGIYKVSGTPGINSRPTSRAVISAIDDAVTDGMDILNISLGAPSLYPWQAYGRDCGDRRGVLDCEPLAVAAQSAVMDFGRVVVAAAGNAATDGFQHQPSFNTVSSPAIAPDVIAVAATVNARRLLQTVRAGPLALPAKSGSGPGVDGSLAGPMALAIEFGSADACDAFPAGSLAGTIVVAERGGCWFVDKIENADRAGAAGVVVYDNTDTGELLQMSSLEDTDIPAYFIAAQDGEALAGLAAPVSITLDASPSAKPSDWKAVGEYSSRGPTPGLNLKPDVAAPGIGVYSATARPADRLGPFRPSGFREVSGTSFSAPVVAGGAALVWQEHPELTAREVASALINTASQDVLEEGATARLTSVGAGLLDLEQALDPIATVEPPTVGFGRFSALDLPVWQEILLTNRSRATHSYRVSVEPRGADPLGIVTLNGFRTADFELAPGEYVTLRATLEGQFPDPGSYEGHLKVTRSGAPGELKVPYLYVVAGNQPHNALAVTESYERGLAGERARRDLAGKFVDANGAPVAGLPVQFSVEKGGARVLAAMSSTDSYGIARTQVEYGPEPGEQVVVAAGGGLEIPFRFEANVQKPRVEEVANAASLEAGRPVAPGSIVTVFGGGFSEFNGEAPLSPLPLSLKSVSASFDFPELSVSVPAPVFQVTPSQIGLLIPWELAGLNFAYLKVRVADRFGEEFTSDPLTLELADVAPGIYVFLTNTGETAPALQHPDGFLITASDPARPGGAVSVLMTGNGPLANPLPTGIAATDPNPTLHQAAVTVGNIPATVTYSGSIPGVAGMYEVDFLVPEDVPSGAQELRITIHGVHSNAVTLPVR